MENCKHKITEEEDNIKACVKCGEILEDRFLAHEWSRHYNTFKSRSSEHSTRKYFLKAVEQISIDFDRHRLLDDFDQQEIVLKEILRSEDKRKNSLNVKCKLYKLLQLQGICYPTINLPKCLNVLKEHDRIMKVAWSMLNWKWIAT